MLGLILYTSALLPRNPQIQNELIIIFIGFTLQRGLKIKMGGGGLGRCVGYEK
jgi:hypothetical protein